VLPSNAFAVRGLRALSDGAALLQLDLPGAGQVSVAAVARLGRSGQLTSVGSWRRRSGAGALSLRLVPSKRALADMRRSGRGLRVSLKVSYAPAGGAPKVVRLRTSLRRPHR
jgi:hypothetical protein